MTCNKHMGRNKNSNTQNHWLKMINSLSKRPGFLTKVITNLIISWFKPSDLLGRYSTLQQSIDLNKRKCSVSSISALHPPSHRTDCITKTMSKFMFVQMTKLQSQMCEEFYNKGIIDRKNGIFLFICNHFCENMN